jgi:FkbM family methyltransferase
MIAGAADYSGYIASLAADETESYFASLFRDAVRPGDVVADVGAFLGYYALTAAAQGATVYAFEPDARNARWCARNIELNRGSVELAEVAISDREGVAEFFCDSHDYSTSSLQSFRPDTLASKVQVRTLDAVIKSRVDIAKIDVEGGEVSVLRGGRAALVEARVIFVELNTTALLGSGSSPTSLLLQLKDMGFTWQVIDEKNRALRPFVMSEDTFANLYCTKT